MMGQPSLKLFTVSDGADLYAAAEGEQCRDPVQGVVTVVAWRVSPWLLKKYDKSIYNFILIFGFTLYLGCSRSKIGYS
jgi:hypothetical protein